MDIERVKTSIHDFIFCCGVILIGIVSLYATGFVGCMFSWNGSTQIGAVNMEMSGIIDQKGKYHPSR